jgi:hypothetical protein
MGVFGVGVSDHLIGGRVSPSKLYVAPDDKCALPIVVLAFAPRVGTMVE